MSHLLNFKTPLTCFMSPRGEGAAAVGGWRREGGREGRVRGGGVGAGVQRRSHGRGVGSGGSGIKQAHM